MASTYVNDLRLNEMATGDGSGTWGTTTNLNLELIAEKFGTGSEALSDASTATITMADGASDAFRSLALTLTGSLSQACTVTLAPNTLSNVWMIKNSAGDAVTLTQGTGANVVIPNGFTKVVYSDGAGAGAAVTDTFDDLSIGPNLIIGNGAAEDTKILFDGNAQDFYIGLDDSADDLIIGLGSTVGTTPIISVDENKDVAIPDGGLTITTSDNTTQLSLISTDADSSEGPVLELYRNSASPADSDVGGQIEFQAENDADEKIAYAKIRIKTADVSDGAETGTLAIQTITAGANRNRFNIQAAETVINEDSRDLDFRVEGNGKTHLLFVDAGNDHVNIGASTDRGGLLNIETSDNSVNLALVSTDADANVGPVLELYRNSSSPADNDELARIYFYGENDNDEKIEYGLIRATIVDASDGDEGSLMQFLTYTGGGQKSRIELLEGETVFNEGSSDIDFRVESDANTNAFFVDGGQNAIGIQTATEHDGTALVFPLTINTGNHSGTALEIYRTTNSRGCWYASNTGTHYLDVYGSSSPNLRFRVAGSDVAKVTSAGICFGSDTAAANALDDYEEGTWTASGSGTSFSQTMTGRYVKIGAMVQFTVYSGNQTLSSSTGTATITGLPFTPEAYYTPVSFAHYNCFSDTDVNGYIQSGATAIYITNEGAVSVVSYTDGSGKYFMVSGCYTTAS